MGASHFSQNDKLFLSFCHYFFRRVGGFEPQRCLRFIILPGIHEIKIFIRPFLLSYI